MSASSSHDQNERERSAVTHPDSAIASMTSQPAMATTSQQSTRRGRLRARLRIASRLRAAAGFRISSPVLLGLIALVMYLAAWLFAESRPLIFHPEIPQLDQASMDPNF